MRRHISASQIARWTRCRYLWSKDREAPRVGPEGGEGDTWAQRIGHFVHAVEALFKTIRADSRTEGFWLDCPRVIGEDWLENGVSEELVKETRRRSKPILNQLWDAFGVDPTHEPDFIEHKGVIELTPDCDLWVIFDDVTLVEEDKTIIIGEYKTSQSPIDAEERTLMNVQAYVEQWAAKKLWPDYKPVALNYTLAHKGGAERVVRDLWPEDIEEWSEILPRLSEEIHEGVIYKALSHFACKGCSLWWSDCGPRIRKGIGPVGESGGYHTEGALG